MTTLLNLTACSVLLASALGCAAAERPPPAVDTVTLAAERDDDDDDDGDEAMTIAAMPSEPGLPRRLCTPRSAQECRFYYTDQSGQRQCPMSYQLCRADGMAWLPCGEHHLDSDNNIVKRD